MCFRKILLNVYLSTFYWPSIVFSSGMFWKIWNIHLLIFYVLFNSSVPTPALTDDITVNWEPLTPAKNQIYRIDLKQSMDAEHNLDRIKYVMEINVVLLYKSTIWFNNIIIFDICQINSIVYLTFSDFGKRTSQSYSRRKKRCKRRRKNCREMLAIRKILVLYFIFSKY